MQSSWFLAGWGYVRFSPTLIPPPLFFMRGTVKTRQKSEKGSSYTCGWRHRRAPASPKLARTGGIPRSTGPTPQGHRLPISLCCLVKIKVCLFASNRYSARRSRHEPSRLLGRNLWRFRRDFAPVEIGNPGDCLAVFALAARSSVVTRIAPSV
jgi:hypothetical protein